MSMASPLVIEYGEAHREKLRIVTFKIEPSKLEEIDRAAAKLGLSRSELIRYALERTIRELGV